MTTDEQPDQTGTWEPDWDALAKVPFEGGWSEACVAAVVEYRRQQAERGIVEVRRDLLHQVKEMVDWLAEPCTAMGDDQAVYDELARLAGTMSGLTATEQQ
jgi:RNase P/RNase MRP subunit POP5